MIWEWIDNCKGFCFSIRHFFRKFVCEEYYTNSYGLPMCAARGTTLYGRFGCEWSCCPKRKDGCGEDGE